MYSKKRKVNYGRIILLVLLLAAVIILISTLFRKNEYISAIDEVLQGNIEEVSGSISSISDVDITVYSNKGIRYTNQHEDIKKIKSFDGTNPENTEKTEKIKQLFRSLYKSKKATLVEDLPLKKNGYYWIDADFIVKDEKLFFGDTEEFNFDLYYDIETRNIYIKQKYYSEFSTKNNELKLQGYEATDEFVKLIDELIKAE
ncbi:MAG: hypothetical protein K0R07_1517 [Sedimentibacter sp.]|nr:hypothetical protein [Sedimentibacter sp.]